MCERGREGREMNGQLGNEWSDVLVSFKLATKVPEMTRHWSEVFSGVYMLPSWWV